MPIYEYRCSKCGDFEVMQRITEKPLAKCPTCKSKVSKLISNTSFQLKGSGWYVTDYARAGKDSGADKGADKTAEPAASESKSESKSEGKAESTTKSEGKGAKGDGKSAKGDSKASSGSAKGSQVAAA